MSNLERELLKSFVIPNMSCGFIGFDIEKDYQALILHAILSKDEHFKIQINKACEWGWFLSIEDTAIQSFFNEEGFFGAVRVHYCRTLEPAESAIFRFKWNKGTVVL